MKLALAASALLLLAACGTDTGAPSDDDGDAGSAGTGTKQNADPVPASVAPPRGQVTAEGTVLDAGRPELCLGAVAESLPPQCSGIPLEGWDWASLDATFYDTAGGTRWGSFAVWGTYDGSTFTVQRAEPPVMETGDPPDDQFASPCEPEGEWDRPDPTKAGQADLEAAFALASALDGYAASWLSQGNVLEELPDGPEAAGGVVNVLVTGEPEPAERRLREVWGGPLCVDRAEHTEAELQEIQRELEELPGLLTGSAFRDKVFATVVWDDGSLQRWADAAYGAGLVRVESELRTVS